MYKRLLCLLLGLMLCCLPALGEEELEMTNDEITRLLWEMYQTENGDIDYTVLPDDYQTPIEGKSGVYNLLLLGIDNPGSAITGRSDTMLLASLNARTGTLKLISFMRDTYVAIPHHGHNTPPMPMAGPSCCWKRWRPPSACRWTAMWPSTIN